MAPSKRLFWRYSNIYKTVRVLCPSVTFSAEGSKDNFIGDKGSEGSKGADLIFETYVYLDFSVNLKRLYACLWHFLNQKIEKGKTILFKPEVHWE